MTKKNNQIFFEGAEVGKTRSGQYYKVILEEEESTIFIKEENVQDINENCQEESELIAVLLAYVEFIRKSTSTDRKKMKKIEEKDLVKSTTKLLSYYSLENLIFYIKSLKWYEIQKIFESSNPVKELEMII